MTFNFEKLEVYKESVEFANEVYEITKSFPKNEVFGITSQLRRSSVSVPSNIAEGSSRGKKEFIRFLNIALGSCYECVPLLEIAKRQKYLPQKYYTAFIRDLHKTSAKIIALRSSLKR